VSFVFRSAVVRGSMGLVLVLLAACSASSTSDAAGPSLPAETPPAATTQPAATPPLPEVLDFAAPKLAGGTVRGADYRGADLAIWFWAPW
jgi:hypothetical protein